jgi:hypothetical protein
VHGKRSLLILFVVAAALGAYIYFVESERDPVADDTPVREKVFQTPSTDFTEIEVRAASGETTTLRKNNNVWEIVAPETAPTDSTEIGGLLSTLESLEVQGVVDDNPPAVAQFGLEPARIAVTFKSPAGESRLLVGKKTPTGVDLYARVDGQPRVFLISAYLEDSLNKTPFGLRDKTILKFERDGADTLMVDRADAPALSFAKQGEAWRMLKPYDAKADFNLVDGLVGRIASARMTSIVTPDGSKTLKQYGLERPAATAIVGAGSSRASIALGSKKDDTSVYARDLSRPLIFTVEASLLDDLKKPADEYRPKDLFEFRSFSALGVDVTVGGQTLTFEKQTAPAPSPSPAATPAPPPPADVWKQTQPAARDIDQSKITDLLTTVSNLRAESFTDKPLAKGEELVFVARFGDAAAPQRDEIRFRKSGSVVHAFRPGETGAAVVSTADFDRALALAKELAGAK